MEDKSKTFGENIVESTTRLVKKGVFKGCRISVPTMVNSGEGRGNKGRWIVDFAFPEEKRHLSSGRKSITMHYPRALMTLKEDRLIPKELHVDHIDDDKTNDSLSNLQIITASLNTAKNASGIHVETRVCPVCGEIFDRVGYRILVNKLDRVVASCGYSCSAKAKNMMDTGDFIPETIEEDGYVFDAFALGETYNYSEIINKLDLSGVKHNITPFGRIRK